MAPLTPTPARAADHADGRRIAAQAERPKAARTSGAPPPGGGAAAASAGNLTR